MECHEPPKPNAVRVSESNQLDTASLSPISWSEEERNNVVTFFTLLDQWDRKLSEQKGAA